MKYLHQVSYLRRCNQRVPIILLSIRYNVCACHIPIPGISLHHCYCCLPSTTYYSCLCRGYVITELVSLQDEQSARNLGVLEVVECSLKERFDMKYLHQVSYLSAFAKCNWCVPIIPLSIRYNVCACHSPIYHYITATVVYLVQRIIAACVVVI